MSTVQVKWLEGKQFVGIDSTSHSVVLSSPADGVGMKPSDLLLVSWAACTAYDVVEILGKKRQELRGLTIEVSGEQEPDAPWAFRRIHTVYRLRGDVTEKAAELTWEYVIES